MRVALTAMPWAWIDLPSMALGTLAPALRREEPGWRVTCFSEHVRVFERLGEAYQLLSDNTRMGQLLYALLLYPERVDAFRQRWIEWLGRSPARLIHFFGIRGSLEHTLGVLDDHLEQLAHRLTGFDVVGLTTTFDQLLPSVALARRLRQRNASAQVVLGGAAVAGDCGPGVARVYHDCVDYVVQGDGEARLLHLLRRLAAGQVAPADGADGIIASAAPWPTRAAARHGDLTSGGSALPLPGPTVAKLDELPAPDFDDYAELAEHNGIIWDIPIEASRGCWWHRVQRTGRVTDSCYFCGLNATPYQQKSAAAVAAEMRAQSRRYGRARFRFVDNIVRHERTAAFARAIRAPGQSLFFELRASIRPREIYELWRAGCDHVQIGVEGLSSSYLRRLGKGTRVIQNLQAMKVCFELRILAVSNLIVGFPGATSAEVAETVRNIRDFAIAYHPLQVTPFRLCAGSAIHRQPERFGITNIRAEADFARVIPAPDLSRLDLPWLEHDLSEEPTDWGPVTAAVADWRSLHEQKVEFDSLWSLEGVPLYYNDGGSFLEIIDRRTEPASVRVLDEVGRELYLFCGEIRTRRAIERRFEGRISTERIERLLGDWSARKLLFSERGRVLALAPARRPDLAAARLEAAAHDEQLSKRRAAR